jgi:hypothetical protein
MFDACGFQVDPHSHEEYSMRNRFLAAALAAMPLFAAAAPTDTEVVEFYNTATNHYFITATAADATFIEAGNAGPGWVRTGRTFSAWLDDAKAAAGSATVYRFYSAGANSHFYTAREDEIELLRRLEADERRAAAASGARILGWQLEGKAFDIQVPVNGACPMGTTAVQRLYNNGVLSGEGSNHRYVDAASLAALMTDRAWIAEGVAFCAQAKPTGTNAMLAATTTNFDPLVGDWTGMGRWKTESGKDERRIPATLQLSVASDGAVTGTGRGCTFTGQVTEGDGFRSLYSGTLSAAGCDDTAFDGSYDRFQLERFSQATLAVHLKRGEGANEASVEVVMSLRTPPVTPPVTPSTPASAGIVGDWSGTVAWTATSRSAGVVTVLVSANQSLSLAIADTGALTGTGYGCAFAGMLAPAGVAGAFGGPVVTTGCTEAVFNGTYLDAKVKRDDGKLEVEMELESESGGITIRANIEGNLASATATPKPPASPGTPGVPGVGISGTFAGSNFTAAIEVRTHPPGSGIVRTITSEKGAASFTIGTGRAVTGSGFGCAFDGVLDGTGEPAQSLKGSITASGCTNAAHNGTYATKALPRNAGDLEFQLERQFESGSGSQTTVTITGIAAKA